MSQDVRSGGSTYRMKPEGGGGGRFGGSGGGGRPRFFRGDGAGPTQRTGRSGPGAGRGQRPRFQGGGAGRRRQEENPALGGNRAQKAVPKPALKGFWGKEKKSGSDEPSPVAAIAPAQPQQPSRQVATTGPQSRQQVVPARGPGRGQIQRQQRGPKHSALSCVPVDKVKISGNVVLNIIKHTKGAEQSSKPKTGHLYGLKIPSSGKAEVTFSISTPDSTKTRTEDAEYCKSYMSCVAETGVDTMELGWYRTAVDGNFFDEAMVQRCFEWQKDHDDAVCMVFDATATKETGRLVLRCFQLTPEFLALMASGDRLGHTSLAEKGITYDTIFREIPVVVHNSYLVHAFLFEHQNEWNTCPFDHLKHADSTVSLSITALKECIDLNQKCNEEYRKWSSQVHRIRQARERAEESGASFVATKFPFPPEPSRLKSMLLLAQMAGHAQRMKGSVIQTQANLQIQAGMDAK